MKTTSVLSTATILFATTIISISSCLFNEGTRCVSKHVGDISLDEASTAFFPFGDSTKLIFKNEAGEEMRFRCFPSFLNDFRVYVEYACTESDFTDVHNYVNAEVTGLICIQDAVYNKPAGFSMELVTKNAVIDSKENTNFYDHFTAVFGRDADANGGGVEIDYITSDRGTEPNTLKPFTDAQKFRLIADTTILGKHFTDLIAAVPTFPASWQNLSFFYQKSVGPIAFSLEDGTVYVFDRKE